MTGREDSAFRLGMARTLLRKAREAGARGEAREAALFARSCIENAAKAILACFTGIPRSHEPADLLEEATACAGFPPHLAPQAATLVEAWRGYGMEEHVALSYGDERNRIDPWSLVTAERAAKSIAEAERAVAFAETCAGAVFGGS